MKFFNKFLDKFEKFIANWSWDNFKAYVKEEWQADKEFYTAPAHPNVPKEDIKYMNALSFGAGLLISLIVGGMLLALLL